MRQRLFLVERDEAESYVLISLAAFAATVVAVRLFLQLTGFPQLGGGGLHIAHLLWGGLALFVAVLGVLIFDNPLALRVAAVLSGIGIGLFIDEVGKFITQNNDYFFPAAAPIIYGFFLLTLILYLYVRRPNAHDPRHAMLRALEDIQDILYEEFDSRDAIELRARLDEAALADQTHVAELAHVLQMYLAHNSFPVAEYNPNLWQRSQDFLRELGLKLGRKRHKLLLVAGLGVIAFSAVAAIVFLTWAAASPQASTQTFLLSLLTRAESADIHNQTWFLIRVAIEFGVGIIALIAIAFFLHGRDREGVISALIAIILSLTAVQLLTFYLDQFTAVLPTLYQFALLAVLLAYQRWYLISQQGFAVELVRQDHEDGMPRGPVGG